MLEIEELKILLQNQIDALENNQFDFLLYNNGAGGEFLSSLISRYSPSYNFPLNGSYDLHGRFITNIYFLANIFSDDFKYTNNINVENLIQIICEELNYKGRIFDKINKFKYDHLILDNHINNFGRALIRTHHIDTRYMNSKNTYFIYPDTEYWQKYRYYLARLKKRGTADINLKFEYLFDQISFTKILPMSKILHKGFLEEIFNINKNEFHIELINWHEQNIKNLRKSFAGVVKW